MSNNTVVNH